MYCWVFVLWLAGSCVYVVYTWMYCLPIPYLPSILHLGLSSILPYCLELPHIGTLRATSDSHDIKYKAIFVIKYFHSSRCFHSNMKVYFIKKKLSHDNFQGEWWHRNVNVCISIKYTVFILSPCLIGIIIALSDN